MTIKCLSPASRSLSGPAISNLMVFYMRAIQHEQKVNGWMYSTLPRQRLAYTNILGAVFVYSSVAGLSPGGVLTDNIASWWWYVCGDYVDRGIDIALAQSHRAAPGFTFP